MDICDSILHIFCRRITNSVRGFAMLFYLFIFRSFAQALLRTSIDGFAAGTIGIAAIVVVVAGSSTAEAATAANANSSIGINLYQVSYGTPEQPFLNIFKTTGVAQATPTEGWITHANSTWNTNEEAYLQLDANGYPTTLTASSSDPNSPQLFNSVGVLLVRNLPNANAGTGLPYRAGQYVVLYEGQGTLTFGFDAKLVSSSPGQYVINVATPTGGGIDLRITSTDPNHTGNYIRNIRVVKAEEASLLSAGNVFEPTFLNKLQNFRVLRFAAWSQMGATNVVGSWVSRSQTTDAGYGTSHGVPWEIEVQLANAVGADPWLAIPHNADDNYITQLATLVHNSLNPSQKVYVEFSNEVWNTGMPAYSYAAIHGQAVWPNAGVSANDVNRSWFGMRTAQTCDIWKSVWGSDWPRVVCVLGAQAANTYTAIQSLNCPLWTGTGNAPCSAHNITAVAIAPYFGFQAPPTWTSHSDGGLSDLFQQTNEGGLISGQSASALGQSSGWEAAYKTALAPYNLPFVGYEGGQTFVGFPTYQNGSPTVNLYVAANRDPRMGAAYTTALNNWKSNGGQVYVLYNDVFPTGQYGEWGALESFLDTTSPLASAPPKWQAIQNFISGNPCWWLGCVGTIGPTGSPVPMPPTNLQVK
jgi:hypothetical protein